MLDRRKERIAQNMKGARQVAARAEAEADKAQIIDANGEAQDIRAQATRDAEKMARDSLYAPIRKLLRCASRRSKMRRNRRRTSWLGLIGRS